MNATKRPFALTVWPLLCEPGPAGAPVPVVFTWTSGVPGLQRSSRKTFPAAFSSVAERLSAWEEKTTKHAFALRACCPTVELLTPSKGSAPTPDGTSTRTVEPFGIAWAGAAPAHAAQATTTSRASESRLLTSRV